MNSLRRLTRSYCSRRNPRLARRAFTLVELVVVISIVGIMLAVLTVVMTRMMRMEVKSRSQLVHSLSLAQLSDQFRQDINRAREIQLESSDDRSRLFVSLPNELRAEYTVEPSAVSRTTRRQDQVVSRERYRLPTNATVQWSRKESGAPKFISMQLLSDDAQSFVVVGEVGRFQYDSVRRSDP